MPLFTPTYGGVPIFGLAVKIEMIPNQAAQQSEAFFGVPGMLSVYGGSRGRTFQVSGVLYDVDLTTLNADEELFTPGVSGNMADGVSPVAVRYPRPHLVERHLSGPVPARPDGTAARCLAGLGGLGAAVPGGVSRAIMTGRPGTF